MYAGHWLWCMAQISGKAICRSQWWQQKQVVICTVVHFHDKNIIVLILLHDSVAYVWEKKVVSILPVTKNDGHVGIINVWVRIAYDKNNICCMYIAYMYSGY